MIGAVVLILLMVTVFPIGLFLSGAVVAALHGWAGTEDAKARYEGSELVDLSERG